jgi:hypothetical protein
MARKLPAMDVVIIGLGWTGSILGYELEKPASTSLRSSAVPGATPRLIFRQATLRTSCVMRCG